MNVTVLDVSDRNGAHEPPDFESFDNDWVFETADCMEPSMAAPLRCTASIANMELTRDLGHGLL